MSSAFIGLGSNVGNRLENIKQAINYLSHHEQIEIVNFSSVYESDPMYFDEQNSFYNAVVEIETNLDPVFLLKKLKEVEELMGRDFGMMRNGPRIIDLDIEFFDDILLESDTLAIPHPRLYERKFVLEPLNEIDKNFKCCRTGKTVESLLQECEDDSEIKKIGEIKI